MKINSFRYSTCYGSGIMPETRKRNKECENKRENLKQNKYENTNTSIENNPDARVSFRGSVPFIHRAANFVSDKPLVAEAIFALLITCLLRPVSIMATASDEEDREKCIYQAAKSILSGVIGLVFTALIGSPIGNATKQAKEEGIFNMPKEMKEKSEKIIKEGVDELKKIKEKCSDTELVKQIEKIIKHGDIDIDEIKSTGKNAIETFKEKITTVSPNSSEIVKKAIKEQIDVNNYKNTAKNVADKIFQPISMPIRAALTIALIPPLLSLAGVKKSDKKQEKSEEKIKEHNKLADDYYKVDYRKQQKINTSGYILRNKKAQEIFKPFVGAAKNEN